MMPERRGTSVNPHCLATKVVLCSGIHQCLKLEGDLSGNTSCWNLQSGQDQSFCDGLTHQLLVSPLFWPHWTGRDAMSGVSAIQAYHHLYTTLSLLPACSPWSKTFWNSLTDISKDLRRMPLPTPAFALLTTPAQNESWIFLKEKSLVSDRTSLCNARETPNIYQALQRMDQGQWHGIL